jgi:LPS O-antigen subunit length determinant protein (WzzB/FepE family)
MNNPPNSKFNRNHDDEIDLYELFYVLWNKKLFIAAITSIFVATSIIYALMTPNIYKSEAIMMPVESNAGMSGMLGQYSGIASLAGISLPSESATKSTEAIARIKSFEFFSNYFLPFINLEDLVAIKKWNLVSNTLIYDEKEFNSELNQWVRKVKPPRSITPSPQEAYVTYKKIMNIVEDKKTSFVSLSIDHVSPFLAQQWVELIINQIDKTIRNQDKQESIKSIDYLNRIAPTVNYEGIKNTLSSLQEEQMKILMMVEANEDYIFKVIELPIAPEIPSEPKRLLIVILGAIMGFMIGVLGSLVFHYTRNPHEG